MKIYTKTKHGVNLWGATITLEGKTYTVTEALRTKIEDGYILQWWWIVET